MLRRHNNLSNVLVQQNSTSPTTLPQPRSSIRLKRHELRRFSQRNTASVSTNKAKHHAQRLTNILDAKSDVLDALNAMTKVHIDKIDECIEILYDIYTDALLFSHRGKHLAPASHPKYHCY
jgi:hypothetical protein